jgi:hypothetical protein
VILKQAGKITFSLFPIFQKVDIIMRRRKARREKKVSGGKKSDLNFSKLLSRRDVLDYYVVTYLNNCY